MLMLYYQNRKKMTKKENKTKTPGQEWIRWAWWSPDIAVGLGHSLDQGGCPSLIHSKEVDKIIFSLIRFCTLSYPGSQSLIQWPKWL